MTGTDRPRTSAAYWQAARTSGLAGAAFGLVAALIFMPLIPPTVPPLLFVLGLTCFSAAFSGLAALGATYLEERLLLLGVKKDRHRAIISFCFAAALTVAITYRGGAALGAFSVHTELQRYLFWGVFAGLAFGAAFALYMFRMEMVRQKLLLLEMQNRHLAELAAREELLQEAARNLAIAEERNRMARELHDSISQGIHGIMFSLHSLRAVLGDNQRAQAILGHLEETTSSTLQELRHLVTELSTSPLEDQGLAEALRLHCDLFARRQQVELTLKLDYHGGLLPDQEMALYRIAQEGLANVQKHAGATLVEVSLQDEGGAVVLTVRDNGRGFDAATARRGHGLANMTARALQNGGSLHIDAKPGEGTTITVRFAKRGGQ